MTQLKTPKGYVYYLTSVLLYFFVACSVYFAGCYFGVFTAPTLKNIVYWDACWYLEVATNGYQENTPMGKFASCAFYPMFPLLWKGLHVDALGMVIFNGLLFCFSSSLLLNEFKVRLTTGLFFVSSPLFVFCFLPYAESLSFLWIALFLIAYNRNQLLFACLAIFMAGLTRPLIWQAIPMALVWVSLDSRKQKDVSFMGPLALLVGAMLSFFVLNLYQYAQSGIWNANMKAYRYWGGKLQMPVLPFKTFETEKSAVWIRQLDYLAFAVSLAGLLYIIWILYKKWFRNKSIGALQVLFAMSCAYLFSIMLIRLGTMKGDFWSVSRYVFVNPFFAFFLFFLARSASSIKYFVVSCMYLLASQIPFIVYKLPQGWKNYTWADMQFFAITSQGLIPSKFRNYTYAILIIGGMLLQCYLLHCFLMNKEWVG